MLAHLLGGVGLFLLGVLLLTEGLKTAAGEALRRILTRFTGRLASAFFSGLTLTALVQSSSATTLATIGFVSAGLLTFAQAIGVVIGGSVGTTTTGWLVALLGLQLSVGKLALPVVGVGALMRLALKGRAAPLGLALAGFGLIFVGIDTLQGGMAGLAERVRPEAFPAATLAGRLLLTLIGAALTVVMQSSSAAIATTLTAFHAGTVNLEQALALVIGASAGTTVTAALAALGASVPARRTALAHILFNGVACALGFLLQPLFALGVREAVARWGVAPGALSLALFHTSFKALGAVCVLPAVPRLAQLATRLIPDRGPALTRHLDDSLVEVPEVAVEAVRRTLADCTRELLARVEPRPAGAAGPAAAAVAPVAAALREARAFLGLVPPFGSAAGRDNPRLAALHALDHLDQLAAVAAAAPAPALPGNEARLLAVQARLRTLADILTRALNEPAGRAAEAGVRALAAEIAALRRAGRAEILDETAHGRLAPEAAGALLDEIRRIDRVAYHLWRIAHHLFSAAGDDGADLAGADAVEESEPQAPL